MISNLFYISKNLLPKMSNLITNIFDCTWKLAADQEKRVDKVVQLIVMKCGNICFQSLVYTSLINLIYPPLDYSLP